MTTDIHHALEGEYLTGSWDKDHSIIIIIKEAVSMNNYFSSTRHLHKSCYTVPTGGSSHM